MRIDERDAAFCKAIDVGRVDFAFVAAEKTDPVIHVVDGDEQDVGASVLLGRKV